MHLQPLDLDVRALGDAQEQGLQLFRPALHLQCYGAVLLIADPSGQAQALGGIAGPVAEPHPLHYPLYAVAAAHRALWQLRGRLIEVLPALMPKVLAKVCKLSTVPVIAGGLVSDKEDVMALLQAGVVSISSTNEKINAIRSPFSA